MANWPDPVAAVGDFYTRHLKPARDIYGYFNPVQSGSGRPAGPRGAQWTAALVLGYASLEAGLEDLLLAAHGVRLQRTGAPLDAKTRRWLVEDRLQAPNPQRIRREVLAAFGVDLDTDPVELPPGSFTLRRKPVARGGAGRGEPRDGPRRWSQLSPNLDALAFIRNATAHGDVRKRTNSPTTGKGTMWVPLEGGGWSVQLPHAASGLRCIVATFNYVVLALHTAGHLGPDYPPMKSPDDIVPI